jgi:hypothetical protein
MLSVAERQCSFFYGASTFFGNYSYKILKKELLLFGSFHLYRSEEPEQDSVIPRLLRCRANAFGALAFLLQIQTFSNFASPLLLDSLLDFFLLVKVDTQGFFLMLLELYGFPLGNSFNFKRLFDF